MKKKQIYSCDICMQEYETELEARQCEERGAAKDFATVYQVGDRVLVKTGYSDCTEPRIIAGIELEHRHKAGYILNAVVSQKHSLLVAEKMTGLHFLYPNGEIRYAEDMDLIPDIPDAMQYILKMLPAWVEYEKDEYPLIMHTNGGTEIRFGYYANLHSKHKYRWEGPFGGPGGALFWYEGIETDNDLKVGLLQCRRFLEEKNLLQF